LSDKELESFLELYNLYIFNLTSGDIETAEDVYYFLPHDLEAFLGI